MSVCVFQLGMLRPIAICVIYSVVCVSSLRHDMDDLIVLIDSVGELRIAVLWRHMYIYIDAFMYAFINSCMSDGCSCVGQS